MPITGGGGRVSPGVVAHFAANAIPAGWLKANGATVSRSAYAALFAAIGERFGAGDGATTFKLPDLRGEFIRGFDDGRGRDAGRAFGTYQADENKAHNHSASSGSAGGHAHTGTARSAGGHTHTGTARSAGAHRHVSPYSDASSGGSYTKVAGGEDTAGGAESTSTDGEHTHALTVNSGGAHTHALTVNSGGAHSHSITVSNRGSEGRPKNTALMPCIKY